MKDIYEQLQFRIIMAAVIKIEKYIPISNIRKPHRYLDIRYISLKNRPKPKIINNRPPTSNVFQLLYTQN